MRVKETSADRLTVKVVTPRREYEAARTEDATSLDRPLVTVVTMTLGRVGVIAVAALIVVAVLALACLFALDAWSRSHPQDLAALPSRTIDINGHPVRILVADRPDTVGPGLSGQPSLAPDQALLLMSDDGDTRITMLGMRFPLDVLWLDASGLVVHAREALPNRPLPLSYSSPQPAVAVLELPAGSLQHYGIQEGDTLPDVLAQ